MSNTIKSFPTLKKQNEITVDGENVTVYFFDRTHTAVYHYKDAPIGQLWMYDAETDEPLGRSSSLDGFVGDAFTVLFVRFEKLNESLGR